LARAVATSSNTSNKNALAGKPGGTAFDFVCVEQDKAWLAAGREVWPLLLFVVRVQRAAASLSFLLTPRPARPPTHPHTAHVPGYQGDTIKP